MSNSKILLGYWHLRGLAQPIRFMAAYIGLEINEKRYTMAAADEWKGDNGDKVKLGLDFPNLPYLMDGEIKLTESRAILKHIAREYGKALNPTKPEDIRTCDEVENVLWDIWLGLLRYLNYDLEPLKEYAETAVPKKMDFLNKFMGNKKFILGEQISYVDFILYEMLYHFTTYKADYLDKYSNLAKFKKQFEEIPAIAKYIASADYVKAPCINPYAKIKI